MRGGLIIYGLEWMFRLIGSSLGCVSVIEVRYYSKGFKLSLSYIIYNFLGVCDGKFDWIGVELVFFGISCVM